MSIDPELDSFKRLDMREYAASQGYVLDRRESWRGSAVMRNDAGDKVVIKLGPDGHYVYFSVRDDCDNGSIIDFVKHRSQANLGGIRKVLRIWARQPASPALPVMPRLEVTKKDRQQVERRYRAMARRCAISIWRMCGTSRRRCSRRCASPAGSALTGIAMPSSRILTPAACQATS